MRQRASDTPVAGDERPVHRRRGSERRHAAALFEEFARRVARARGRTGTPFALGSRGQPPRRRARRSNGATYAAARRALLGRAATATRCPSAACRPGPARPPRRPPTPRSRAVRRGGPSVVGPTSCCAGASPLRPTGALGDRVAGARAAGRPPTPKSERQDSSRSRALASSKRARARSPRSAATRAELRQARLARGASPRWRLPRCSPRTRAAHGCIRGRRGAWPTELLLDAAAARRRRRGRAFVALLLAKALAPERMLATAELVRRGRLRARVPVVLGERRARTRSSTDG